jgi:hypothetical protein
MDSSHAFRGLCQNLQECAEISKEMVIYRMASGTFGFDMAIRPKCQVSFILFQISMSLLTLFQLSTFNVFSHVSLICCRCLVDKLWVKSAQFTNTCHSGA